MRALAQAQPVFRDTLADLAARLWRGAGRALRTIACGATALLERSRQPNALSCLPDDVLKDIGLSRAKAGKEEAGKETDKWLWQS